MKDYTLAKAAYDGYCATTGRKSPITSEDLPEFESLKAAVQDMWYRAALAVGAAITGTILVRCGLSTKEPNA